MAADLNKGSHDAALVAIRASSALARGALGSGSARVRSGWNVAA